MICSSTLDLSDLKWNEQQEKMDIFCTYGK